MQVMWISIPIKYRNPVVKYGINPFNLNHKSAAIIDTYNVGHIGFHGFIYRSVLSELQ